MYTARLRADKMAALKTKDTVKNKVITMLLSGITYKQKELGRELTEQECLDVISKESHRRPYEEQNQNNCSRYTCPLKEARPFL